MEWRKFYLVPEQQSPEGSQGWCVPDGGIAWYGENFPKEIRSEPMTQAEIDYPATVKAKNDLAEIDLKSIRSLREYVASLQDAPKFIKDFEAEAATVRAKL